MMLAPDAGVLERLVLVALGLLRNAEPSLPTRSTDAGN